MEEVLALRLDAVSQTDVGMVREHNEDNFYIDPDHRFFIVADGMGGHAAGEVASQMAVDHVRHALETCYPGLAELVPHNKISDEARQTIIKALHEAVVAAHSSVLTRGQTEPDKAGMGTTLDVVLYVGGDAFMAHVGDSRTYLMRGGQIMQVTTDHTLTEMLVLQGKLSTEEASVHPYRNILVNAIGVSPDLAVETAHVTLVGQDRLLMCSDGLHDYFPSAAELLAQLHGSIDSLRDGLNSLVEQAKTRGGHDNITAVVVLATEDTARTRRNTEETIPKDLTNTTAGYGDTIAPAPHDTNRAPFPSTSGVPRHIMGDTLPPAGTKQPARKHRRRSGSKRPKR